MIPLYKRRLFLIQPFLFFCAANHSSSILDCFSHANVLVVSLHFSVFAVAHCSFDEKNLQSISTGTSFGMCRGYCRHAINITSNPLQIIASKDPNFPQTPYPPLREQHSFSANQWQELISVLNLETFRALDDRIGCPDCADGGAEWIEINWIDGVKRVTFENRRAVKGIEALIEKLRQMRQEYLS